jgi:hypothetical protein
MIKTKLYLSLVALLAFTGGIKAANPTPFASIGGVVGVAAVPQLLFASSYCNNNFYVVDCNRNVSLLGQIPGTVGSCVEKYMAVAPIQSAAAGFTPRDIFVTNGDQVYKYDVVTATFSLFASLGCPFSDHSSLTFDHEGTFENKMIATCENGSVSKINGAGVVEFIANTSLQGQGSAYLEGPVVVPEAFGPLGGQILAADDVNGQVHAIKNDGTVTLNVFPWPGAESVQVIPNQICAACEGRAYFQAVYDLNEVDTFPLTDFAGLAGSILVNSETHNGTTNIRFDDATQSYVQTLFDIFPGQQEGASFVDCDVPPPTCTGTFVIGDQDAVVGRKVTFWGASWWKLNHTSGGRIPASFKGFANCSQQRCGSTWTSAPGNSSGPPDAPLPADITVLVASQVTKSGPIENGNVVKMVTVHVDPGYEPNPGHAGTGTVTAVLCVANPARPVGKPAARPVSR